MGAATIITPIRSCAAATASYRWTSTSRAARRPPGPCSTGCCCCRRRFAASGRSNARRAAPAMDEALQHHAETIADALKGSLLGRSIAYGELTVTVAPRDIVAAVTGRRDDGRRQYFSIIDVTASDWPSRERRFDVVYHFLSPTHNRRIRVKIEVGESTPVPSIIGVFPGADWLEREVY